MKINLYVLLCLLFATSCNQPSESPNVIQKYAHDVGDILYDKNVDDANFMLCDSTKIITRRKALAYLGDRNNIGAALTNSFNYNSEFAPFSGYVTVRFIVNCNKESGRFRAQSTGWDFSLKECPESLKNHLVSIVRDLEGWDHAYPRDANFDMVKFINFKIVNGKLENVLQ